MTQFLSNLSDTINSDLLLTQTSKEIELSEATADCKKVILTSSSKKFFAFSLDRQFAHSCKMFPFFKQSTSVINKVNDGIIFYIKNNEIFVLLIELKSNHLSEYKKQLQAGKNFVFYLQSILNSSFSKSYIIKDNNIKCLVFSLRKTARKQSSSRKKIKYKLDCGLNIAELECNETHHIEKFMQ